MREKVFAICDTEEAYAFRLTEYMMEKIRVPYTLHLFTKAEELQKFAMHEKIAVLLIAQNALRALREACVRQQVEQIFVLREREEESCYFGEEYMPDEGAEKEGRADKETVEEETEEASDKFLLKNEITSGKAHYISKFQSPEKIVETLYESVAGIAGWSQNITAEEEDVKLIGIYSPVKRCLQTSYALTLGQVLAKEHRTLYINFECYSGFAQMLKREFPMDVMDLMYYFRCDRDKLALKLPSIVQSVNGLDYIPPMQSYTGIREAGGGQWLELCRYIAGIGQYEYIILDLDDCMDGVFELLRSCYRIYTITREDGFAVAKLNQYEQILKFHELEEIAEKTVKCKFPVFKELPVNLELMTHGELAGYVKAIVKEDLYGR